MKIGILSFVVACVSVIGFGARAEEALNQQEIEHIVETFNNFNNNNLISNIDSELSQILDDIDYISQWNCFANKDIQLGAQKLLPTLASIIIVDGKSTKATSIYIQGNQIANARYIDINARMNALKVDPKICEDFIWQTQEMSRVSERINSMFAQGVDNSIEAMRARQKERVENGEVLFISMLGKANAGIEELFQQSNYKDGNDSINKLLASKCFVGDQDREQVEKAADNFYRLGRDNYNIFWTQTFEKKWKDLIDPIVKGNMNMCSCVGMDNECVLNPSEYGDQPVRIATLEMSDWDRELFIGLWSRKVLTNEEADQFYKLSNGVKWQGKIIENVLQQCRSWVDQGNDIGEIERGNLQAIIEDNSFGAYTIGAEIEACKAGIQVRSALARCNNADYQDDFSWSEGIKRETFQEYYPGLINAMDNCDEKIEQKKKEKEELDKKEKSEQITAWLGKCELALNTYGADFTRTGYNELNIQHDGLLAEINDLRGGGVLEDGLMPKAEACLENLDAMIRAGAPEKPAMEVAVAGNQESE